MSEEKKIYYREKRTKVAFISLDTKTGETEENYAVLDIKLRSDLSNSRTVQRLKNLIDREWLDEGYVCIFIKSVELVESTWSMSVGHFKLHAEVEEANEENIESDNI